MLSTGVSAQVGINTISPLGLYHIHIGNTASTANDVVISPTGNLGIHVTNPQAKLDLKGSFRVTGLPTIPAGEKYLIVAETDGTFNAIAPGNIPTVMGNIPTNLSSLAVLPVSGAAVNYTTINITLPRGRWIVYFTATHSLNGKVTTLAAAEGAVIKWQMINSATGSTDNISADYSTAGFVNAYASTVCIFVVDNLTGNTTNASKTYYFRGAATTQNSMSFVHSANLWAEYYTLN